MDVPFKGKKAKQNPYDLYAVSGSKNDATTIIQVKIHSPNLIIAVMISLLSTGFLTFISNESQFFFFIIYSEK